MQTALLSASNDNVILKAKQIICLESLYLKKICSPSYQQDTTNPAQFARAKSAFRKFAYSARVQFMKRKKLCNVVRLFSAVVNLSAGARYTKYIANLVPSVLSLAMCILFFSGVVDIFKYPRHQLSNKRGGKLLSGPDRATYGVATIIYCSSPPLFLAPTFWIPLDQPQPGFFSKQEREPWERGCLLWFSDVGDTFSSFSEKD